LNVLHCGQNGILHCTIKEGREEGRKEGRNRGERSVPSWEETGRESKGRGEGRSFSEVLNFP